MHMPTYEHKKTTTVSQVECLTLRVVQLLTTDESSN